MPDPRLAKELFSRMAQGVSTPLAPEWKESPNEPALISGGEFGKDSPLINKVWPGGAHIPGAREIYNEGLRPVTSILGLLAEGTNRTGISNLKAPISKRKVLTNEDIRTINTGIEWAGLAEPSLKIAGSELVRLIKLKAAREGLDWLSDAGSKVMDKALNYDPMLVPLNKRTEDIELK